MCIRDRAASRWSGRYWLFYAPLHGRLSAALLVGCSALPGLLRGRGWHFLRALSAVLPFPDCEAAF
eukprot:232-Alexandrium_andersonii.AAC.1